MQFLQEADTAAVQMYAEALVTDPRAGRQLAAAPEVIDASTQLVAGSVAWLGLLDRVGNSLTPKARRTGREQYDEACNARFVTAARTCLAVNGIAEPVYEATPSKHLVVTVDPARHISLNYGPPQSISRPQKAKRNNTISEIESRELRLTVLETLSRFPDTALQRAELWNEAFNGKKFNASLWEKHIRTILFQPPVYGAEPLVHVLPINRQTFAYVFGNFDTRFKHTDELFKDVTDPIFTFENGREVAGKAGIILHMLDAATPRNPVTNNDILGLYTQEELDALTTPEQDMLLSWVRTLDSSYMRQHGGELEIVGVAPGINRRNIHQQSLGYYLEPRLSVAETAIVISFIQMHDHVFCAEGIALPEADVITAVLPMQRQSTGIAPHTLQERRRSSFDKIVRLVSDEKRLHQFKDKIARTDSDDPRLAVVDYFARTIRDQPNSLKAFQKMFHDEYRRDVKIFHTDKTGVTYAGKKPKLR